MDRAFDVLAEMRSEIRPIDPDHITVGALIKACIRSSQVRRSVSLFWKELTEFMIVELFYGPTSSLVP